MLKLVALVALFAGFCWVGTHLQLGPHTLFGHLRAIAQTKESQELFDGTRASAGPLVDDVRRRIAGVPAPAKAPAVEEADDAPTDPKAKVANGELAKAEDAKPDKVTADKAKPESTKPESTKPDSTTPDSTKPEPTRAEVARAARRRLAGGPAQETLTPAERRHLRRLISSAEGASARQ
jgi:hypothetical protein